MATMPFGKHKGEQLSDLPSDYLDWLLTLDNLRPWLRSEIAAELERRYGPRPQPEKVRTGLPATVADQWRRQLAREFHPDVGGSHEAMKAVNRGYDLLCELIGGTS